MTIKIVFAPLRLAFCIAFSIGWVLDFSIGTWAGWFSLPLFYVLWLGIVALTLREQQKLP